jgi:hypothetical protein
MLPTNQWKLLKKDESWHHAIWFLLLMTMYERCLMALWWLMTIPPAMARDIIFPADNECNRGDSAVFCVVPVVVFLPFWVVFVIDVCSVVEAVWA